MQFSQQLFGNSKPNFTYLLCAVSLRAHDSLSVYTVLSVNSFSISLSSATIFGFGGACNRPWTVPQTWYSKRFDSSEFRRVSRIPKYVSKISL